MNRRQLLQTAAGSSVIGVPLLSGCLGALRDSDDDSNINGSNTDESNRDRTKYDWCVSGKVTPDALVGDTVIGRRDVTENRLDWKEVVGLNAETGSIEWSYEPEADFAEFVGLTVADGIYLTQNESENANGVVVLDMDGTKRWIVNLSSNSPSPAIDYHRPRVGNDTVYVTSRTGVVYAFDAASGDRRWEYELKDERTSPTIVDVTDTLTVETNYAVTGHDPATGTVRWEFDTGDQDIRATQVIDGTIYVVTDNRIAAVSEGAEQWSTGFDTSVGIQTRIVGTTSERVVVYPRVTDREYQLQAFDLATGELSWTSELIQLVNHPRGLRLPTATVFGDTVYLGVETLRAIDATIGDERWQASVGDGVINHLTVIDDGAAADHTVFVQGGETQLATFSPDGEQTWIQSVDAPNQVSARGEYVFVETDSEFCAMNRLDDS